jgi:uncharacterized membrane protein (UPF0127 family)
MGTGFAERADAPPSVTSRWLPLALLALLVGAAPRAEEPAREPLERFPRAELSIDSGVQVHRFQVWVAATEPRRNQGLMFVKSLPPTRGMVFVFERPQVASFWMKNTFIPLDLLFVAPDGRVIRAVENAEPQSLATISSMGLVSSVVELAGGSCARLGIHPGDRVRSSALGGR